MARAAPQGEEPVPDPEVVRTLGAGAGRSRRLPAVVALVVLCAALGGVGAYFRWFSGAPREAAVRYETVEVQRGDLRVIVTATGTIQGLSSVEVGTEVTGKVTKVHVDANDRVEKGQLLAEIDTEQLDASVEESRARVAASDAQIAQAKATVEETTLALARAEAQLREGIASRAELESAQAAAARAKAQLRAAQADATVARAALKNTSSRQSRARIVSPVTGIVLKRAVEEGQTVTAGFSTPLLFKLTEDLTKMRLSVFVDEADVGRVKDGLSATFTVDAFPDRTFPSRVLSVRYEPTTENNVVSYEAILQVDNADLSLRPGMTASATIVSEKREAVLLVPNLALRFAPAQPNARGRARATPMPGLMAPPPVASAAPTVKGPRVHKLDAAGKPAPVPVTTGATDGERTEILSGLEQGDRVVTDLAEGAP